LHLACIGLLTLAFPIAASAYDHLEIEVVNPDSVQGLPAVTVEVPFSVRVRAVDQGGNTDPSADFVHAELYSPDVNATLPPAHYLQGGEWQFDNCIFHDAGNAVRLKVRDADDGSVPHATVFINSYNFVDHFIIGLPPGDKQVGLPISVTITAVDANSSTIANFDDTVTLTADVGHFLMGPNIVVPGSSFNLGTATLFVRFLGTDPISYSNILTATNSVQYPGQGAPAQSSAVVSPLYPGALRTIVLLLPGETLTPGISPGKTGTPVTQTSGMTFDGVDIYATDEYWNPVRSAPYPDLDWSTSDPDVNVELPAPSTMGSNSDLDNEVKLVTAGLQRVTVDASGPITDTDHSWVTVGPEGLDHFVFDYAVWDTSDVQVTTSPFNIRVRAEDLYGNDFPFNGIVSIRVRIAQEERNDWLLIDNVQFVDGLLETTVQVTKRAFSARLIVDSLGGVVGESGRFQVNSGPLEKFLITFPGQNWMPGINDPDFPGYVGDPEGTIAGDVIDSVWIRPVDVYKNIATGSWLVNVACPTGYFELPNYGDNIVQVSGPTAIDVILRTHQQQRLSSEAGPGTEGISSNVSVTPSTFDRIVIEAPGESLDPGIFETIENDGKIGTPSVQDAGISFDVTVYACDAYWNPVQDSDPVLPMQIDFSSSDAAATLPVGPQTVGSNTEYFEAALRTLDEQSQQVITIDDLGSAATAFTTVPLQAGAIDHFDLGINNRATPTPNDPLDPIPDVQAGANLPNVTVVARDQFGNHITNYTEDGSLSVTHGSNVVTPVQIDFDDGFGDGSPYNGVWRGSVRITKAGDEVQLVVREDITAVTDSSNVFAVYPGAYADLLVMLPGEVHTPGVGPGKIGNPLPATVGETMTSSVVATDTWWNQVPEQPTVNLETSGYSVLLSGNNVPLEPDGHRDFDLYFRTAGVQNLAVKDLVEQAITDTSTVALSPGEFVRLQVIAPGESPNPGGPETDGKIGAPDAQTASLQFDVGVRSVDQFWNLVINNDEHIQILSDDGSLDDTNPPNQGQPLLDGSITFPIFLTSTGSVRIEATPMDNLDIDGHFVDVTILPGAHYVIEVPDSAFVGPPRSFPMTISLVDSLGQVEQGANNEVFIEAFKSNLAPPSGTLGFTSIQLASGTATILNQTYDTVEDIILQVTDRAGREMNSTPIVMMSNGMEYQIAVDGNPDLIVGPPSTFSVTVELRDVDTATLIDSDRQFGVEVWSVADDAVGPGRVGVNGSSLQGGRVVFEQSYTKAEAVYLSIQDTTDLVGNSPIFNLGADGYKRVQVLVPGEEVEPGDEAFEETGKSGTPDAQRSGEPFNIVVRAVDQYWNLADTTAGGTVHLDASDGSFENGNPWPQDVPFVNGKRTVEAFLVDEGVVEVTALDSDDLDRPEQRVDIPVLSSYAYEIIVPESAITGQVPGFQVSVRLYDPETDMTVQDASNRFTMTPLLANLNAGNGNLGIPEGQLIEGVDVINTQTYDVVEDILIRVSDDFGREAYSTVIHMETGGLYYEVTLPDSAMVGPPETFPIDVALIDSNTENVVMTRDGPINIVVFSANSGQPGDGDWSVNYELLDEGTVHFNQSYSKAEEVFVQVSDSTGVTGISNTCTVMADGYKRIQLLVPGETPVPGVPSETGKDGDVITQQAEVPFLVTTRAVDQYWNRATTVTGGSINLDSSEGSLGTGNPVNQGDPLINGSVSFEITLSQHGAAVLTAADSLTADIAIGTATVPINDAEYEIVVPEIATVGPPSSFTITVRLVNPTTGERINANNTFTLLALKPNRDAALDTLGVGGGTLSMGEIIIRNQTYATAQDIVIQVSDDLGREATSEIIHMEPVGIRYDVVVPEFAEVGPPATFDMVVRLVDVETGQVVTGDDRSFDIQAINSTTGTPGVGELGIATAFLVDGVSHLQQTYTALENIFFLVSDDTGDQVFSTTVQMRAAIPNSMDISVTPDPLRVRQRASLTATLTDLYGHPVAGRAVSFDVLSGRGSVDADSATTNSEGEASVRLSVDGIDDIVIWAQAAGVGERMLTLPVLRPTGIHNVVVGDSVLFGGEPPTTLTAVVQDPFGDPYPFYPVEFKVISGDGWVDTDSTVTDTLGQAIVNVHAMAGGSEDLYIEVTAAEFAPWPVSLVVLAPPVTEFEFMGPASNVNGGYVVTPETPIRLSASSELDVGAIYYGVNLGSQDVPRDIYAGELTLASLGISDPGAHMIRYYATDVEGHEGEIQEMTVYLTTTLATAKQITNRPNPFKAGRESTVILFRSNRSGQAEVTIYDPYGNRVWSTLVAVQAGVINQIAWDGRNGNGAIVGNGGYVCRVKTPDGVMKRKIAVVK